MGETVCAHAIIRGRVQGVCFRMETRFAAERLNVSGWVRNKADGTVEAFFAGEEGNVKAALEWCRTGPPAARVDGVDITRQTCNEVFSGFQIRYD